MQDISDIKIVGIDEKRPPKLRKEPYIDLFFTLSHQVPGDWCDDFNRLTGKLVPPVKVNKSNALFIETYVRDMNQIQAQLDKIKQAITTCNEQYIENIRQMTLAAAGADAALAADQGPQGELNAIIAGLNFDDSQ